jgi:phospholipid/cholesterol/gamma-HCH transport system substrate-binding protein/paraquat-inducible protein B
MSTKANYFKIGVFVVVAAGLLVASIVAFAMPRMRKPMYIETYMDESVAGLNVGSKIAYRGVDIGRVENITFVSNRYESCIGFGRYVVIDMVIESDLLLGGGSRSQLVAHLDELVENGLRIRLTTNPLTGLAYLEADYPRAPAPLLNIDNWVPKYYYLPSDKSTLNKFGQSAQAAFETLKQIDVVGLADKLDKLLISVDSAVKGANVEQISGMLSDLLNEVKSTAEQIKLLLAFKEDGKPEVTVGEMLAKMDEVLEHIDQVATSQAPDIAKIMDDLREFSANIRQLSEDIKRNPSKLISKPARSEVVE